MANAEIVANCDTEHRPRRRYTPHHGGRYVNNKRKRRSDIVLPTKFLLGGNINDPLNLASFSGESDQVTPHSSPLPTPKHKKEVEVLIPANLKDPLNLNSSDPESVSPIVAKPKRSRKRKRKRTDSDTTIEDESRPGRSTNPQVDNNHEVSIDSSGNVIADKCPKLSPSNKDGTEKKEEPLPEAIPQPSWGKKVTDDPKNVSNDKRKNTRHNSRSNRNLTQHRFRPKDAKFVYGNYNRYYGYRNQNMAPDPRLKSFQKEWFENQDILDIGCNIGHVTLIIARDFNPKKIVGIDIDENLIKVATRNIRHYVTNNQNCLKQKVAPDDPPKLVKDSLNETNKVSPPSGTVSNSPRQSSPLQDVSDKESLNNLKNLQTCHQLTEELSVDKSPSPKESTQKLAGTTSQSFSSLEIPQESTRSTLDVNEIETKASLKKSPSASIDHNQENRHVETVSVHKLEDDLNKDHEKADSKIGDDKSELEFKKPSEVNNFPHNVQFFTGNYVFENDDLLKDVTPEYDCILCLSITKWIHLNFGDKGLKRAFKRMHAQLRPGGRLILEAQPWCSYKKKKNLTECTLNNYWSIKFKPEHFNEYLLSREVGFSTLELVDTPLHESKGFRRPIFMFRKAQGSKRC